MEDLLLDCASKDKQAVPGTVSRSGIGDECRRSAPVPPSTYLVFAAVPGLEAVPARQVPWRIGICTPLLFVTQAWALSRYIEGGEKVQDLGVPEPSRSRRAWQQHLPKQAGTKKIGKSAILNTQPVNYTHIISLLLIGSCVLIFSKVRTYSSWSPYFFWSPLAKVPYSAVH